MTAEDPPDYLRRKPAIASYRGVVICRVSALLLIVLGAVVVGGWVLGNAQIIRVNPGFSAMQFPTAAGYFLFGTSLLALSLRAGRLASWLALLPALIGGVQCLEYLLGRDLGIPWLFSFLPVVDGVSPGRSSPPTSIGLFLSGIALLVVAAPVHSTVKRSVAWIVSSFIISMSAMALIGYVTGLSGTYAWGSFAGMALHTAAGMGFLGLGILGTQLRPVNGLRSVLHEPWLQAPLAVAPATATLILWHALVIENSYQASAGGGSGRHGALPHLILVLGILMTALLLVAFRALQQARSQANATKSANDRLHQEIDERLAVSAKLMLSEGRLQHVMDSATGVAIIGVDLQGIISFYNKGAESLLGYRAEEMTGMASPSIFHDPEEMRVRGGELSRLLGREVKGFEIFTAIPSLEGRERREWTYICKDGSRKTVDLNVTVSRNAQGFLGTAIDVTARKAAEQLLMATIRAEKDARALLDAAGRIARVGHWSRSMDGSNPIWSDVTYEIHEIPIGTPVSLERARSFYLPEDFPIVEKSVKRSLETGEAFEFEVRLVTAKRRTIWVHVRGEPVFDDSGKVTGLRGVFQDVNDRHEAADLLSLRNAELVAATASAEANARAKAEFLANMSHEIRTPLNAIIGMSELLHESATDARQREFVNTIRTSGDALLGVINDILDFSKIDAGQLEMERIPVDLYDCVESSLDLVSGQALKKKLDLLYWIEPSVPAFILGDPSRLRQILVNLLSNGVKFTERGQVFVRITRSTVEGASDRLCISVKDTGMGIPGDRQDRLFQSFSQVDSSTSRRFGGTGLGLAICQRLVNMMGGRIWVESEPGGGADFKFEFPLEAALNTGPLVFQRGAVSELEGLKVLLVDDNETNLWILEKQTRVWGMIPRTTSRPSEAVAWVQGGDAFDFAIVDGQMPEMSGLELASALRQLPAGSQFPILMLTSMGDVTQDQTVPSVNAVLTKPVKTGQLAEVVGRLLLGRRVGRHAPISSNESNMGEECPLKILVAEDNQVNQRVITLLLERLGYRAEVVGNGLEVLEALDRCPFDLILLDIQMPEMDGLQAAREIHLRTTPDKRPYMIALTANAVEGDRDACLAAGMEEYLSKPVRAKPLAEALRAAYASRCGRLPSIPLDSAPALPAPPSALQLS